MCTTFKPVVQVLAELSGDHQLMQVAMRGRNDAHVNGHGVSLPTGRIWFSCNTRSNLTCRRMGMSPTSSSSSVPPSAVSNTPFLRARRTIEGAFLVAEEFGFQEIFGHGAAVDGNEGLIAARAGVVNGARQQFLAGAALAGQQHAGVGTRDHVGLRQLVFH
jgi:hypothetical protein